MSIKFLTKGATIGVVAPANFVDQEKLICGGEVLKELGFRLIFGESCHSKWFSFAGKDDVRASDINIMFANPDVDAIICARGGYGSIRLLEKIDFDNVRRNPKLLIGYSDITSLHIAINKLVNIPTIHGPMLASSFADDFDDLSKKSFIDCTRGEFKSLVNPENEELKVISNGQAEGQIIGGNLSLIVASLGTKYEIDTLGKILFIEELNEKTFRIDKMLNQLKLSGKFEDCDGIILGDFNNCQKDKDWDFSLSNVFKNNFECLKKPVINNLKSGHCKPMLSVPFGIKAKLIADSKQVSINFNHGMIL